MTAWWPLDESTGTTAKDMMGSNDGSYFGESCLCARGESWKLPFVQLPGNYNNPDYLQVLSAPEINFGGGDFSIDAWINPTDLGF